LVLAESHLTGRLFTGMRRKIAALPSPAGQGERKAEQISMKTLGEGRSVCRTIQIRCISGGGVPTRCENRHRW
jgi:hypothetical protein